MRVYKYRGGNSNQEIFERDLGSIANNYFWAATANQLNDPGEAYVNDEDFRSWLKDSGARNVEAAFDGIMNMRHKVGVYSLSQTPLDELMWAYYSEGHTGFCIEYDLDRLILEARSSWNVANVTYHPKPQKIDFDDVWQAQDEKIILGKMIGTKSTKWKHEKEVRIITNTAGKNHYAPNAVTGIYFGCRCEESTILKARQTLQGRNHKYHRIKFADDSYSMTPLELEYDPDIDGERIEHLAPIQNHAIPKIEQIKDVNKPFYEYLAKAAEIVRRDNSCEEIILVGFSIKERERGEPTVYVRYKTNVPTELNDEPNQYLSIDEIDNRSAGIRV